MVFMSWQMHISLCLDFQYSLCRVVLMVSEFSSAGVQRCFFQYSLCRVVLMVDPGHSASTLKRPLSVLALSSRFDGRAHRGTCAVGFSLSVLALSSRFDGLERTAVLALIADSFSTRSVESF